MTWDLKKLCIHTITTKPWSLNEALEAYAKKEIGGISIWQNAIAELGVSASAKLIKQYPIEVVSYVRGGFFAHGSAQERQAAIDNNKKMLDEAAEIGAPTLVLVCGADPGSGLIKSREQISDGIQALTDHAASVNVTLSIEPLHPMYADTRSAINTLQQANDIAESIGSDYVGVAIDVYHLWWDPALRSEIIRCGEINKIFAYHICDWKYPTEDMLNDRGLMGEGCIPIQQISQWIDNAGFDGFHEVEIFSNKYWAMDQHIFLDKIIDVYQDLYFPVENN